MTKFLRNHRGRGETSGSAAANRTSFPAIKEAKLISRTPTIIPLLNRPLKPTRSTHSLHARTCVEEKLSFMMYPVSLSSHWCSTCAPLQGAYSVTRNPLVEPTRRHLITGSSCQAEGVTLYLCPLSCHASSSLTPLLMQRASTLVPLAPAAASSSPHCQVSQHVCQSSCATKSLIRYADSSEIYRIWRNVWKYCIIYDKGKEI